MGTAPLLLGLLTNRKAFKEGWSSSLNDSANKAEYVNPYPQSSLSEHRSFFKGYLAGTKSVAVEDAKCDARLTYSLPKPYNEDSLGRLVYEEEYSRKIKRIARRNPDAAVPKPLLKYYNAG